MQSKAFVKDQKIPPTCIFWLIDLNTPYVTLKAALSVDIPSQNGFGGLEVACWPLVPKFAGSNRRIFKGEKILSTPSFGGEVKPSCPMSQICGM
jgi:hypothetical protein